MGSCRQASFQMSAKPRGRARRPPPNAIFSIRFSGGKSFAKQAAKQLVVNRESGRCAGRPQSQVILDVNQVYFEIVGDFRGFPDRDIRRQMPVRYGLYGRVILDADYVRDDAIIWRESRIDKDAVSRRRRAIARNYFNFRHDTLLRHERKLRMVDRRDGRALLIFGARRHLRRDGRYSVTSRHSKPKAKQV